MMFENTDRVMELKNSHTSTYSLIVQITRFRSVFRFRVLSNHNLTLLDRHDTFQKLYFLVSNCVSGRTDRRFHRHETQNLKQTILNDVSNDTVLVEISTSSLRSERFLET